MWNDSEFNSTFSSPGAGGKDVKKNMIRHIVPITCQTVNLCAQVEGETSVFEYEHLRFNQICLVGLIRNVIKRANDVTYLLDDMTSSEISVKLQADEPDDIETEEVKPAQVFMENQYVKVFGIIKSLQGQKNVQAFKIVPIKELNEITHHMLECMNASIYYICKANGQNMENVSISGSGGSGSGGTRSSGNMDTSVSGGLSGLNLNISNLIRQAKSSEGIQFRDICDHFKTIPPAKIRECLEFLSTEGQIYSTIDDEHFKSSDF
jgi:replication factor A2